MNEWKKLSEEIPPLETPVWAGWFNEDGSFTSGIFVLADDDCDDDTAYYVANEIEDRLKELGAKEPISQKYTFIQDIKPD